MPDASAGPGPARRERSTATLGLTRSYIRSGRRDRRKVAKLVNAQSRYCIWALRGLNRWDATGGANRGFYSLYFGNYNGGGGVGDVWKTYPVHCWNLTCIVQGGGLANGKSNSLDTNLNPYTGFVLQQAVAPNVINPAMRWCGPRLLSTFDSIGGIAAGDNRTGWLLERDSDITTAPLGVPVAGRKHYLDWVDLRMMIYAKRRFDTRFTVSMVQFLEDEYCPEFYNDIGSAYTESTSSNKTGEVGDYYRSFVSPLINNPINDRPVPRAKGAVYRTLFKRTFVIGSKQTDDTNQDVQVEMFKMFKRFGRVRDHTNVRGVGAANAETAEQLADEANIFPSNFRPDYSSNPSRLRDNIYLMITSHTPHDYGSGDLNAATYTDYQNSYDLIVRKKVIVETKGTVPS